MLLLTTPSTFNAISSRDRRSGPSEPRRRTGGQPRRAAAQRWRAQLRHYLPLIERILAQSQRRVLDRQAVPAGEKLVSLFEPHADIIVKGARDVQ